MSLFCRRVTFSLCYWDFINKLSRASAFFQHCLWQAQHLNLLIHRLSIHPASKPLCSPQGCRICSLDNQILLKPMFITGVVQWKRRALQSFIHPNVLPKWYGFIACVYILSQLPLIIWKREAMKSSYCA